MANKKKKASGAKPSAPVQQEDSLNLSTDKKGADVKPAKKSKSDAKAGGKKPNLFVRMGKGIKKFVKGFFSEGKKIIWADGKTVLKNTGVVLAVIVFIGIFVWLFDFGIEKLMVYSVSASPKLQTSESADETQAQTEQESETQTDAPSETDSTAAEAGMMNLLDGFILD